jgi:hypothetical protein
MGGGPSLQGEPKRAGPRFPESFDRTQFKDSLSVLHDLVFELRQEVADLNYRLQATDVKVASFLKILSSLHEALLSDPVETSPMEDPEAAKGGDQRKVQSPAETGRKKEEREDDIKGAECNEEVGKQWDDGPTYIEEEPWPGDLHATWSGYLPGV